MPDVDPSDLLWSPDSKRIAFTGTLNGTRGTLFVEIPDGTRPQLLNAATGSGARWLDSNQIVWVSSGTPASLSLSGRASNYSFRATQEFDLRKKHKAAFELAWRIMRDSFYDARLGNRDWNAIREKYRAAAETPDVDALATVANLMLGELNGSHLGFSARADVWRRPRRFRRLAARADADSHAAADARSHARPHAPTGGKLATGDRPSRRPFRSRLQRSGLKIRDVIPDGPADRERSKLQAGEVILKIDGTTVDPADGSDAILNGPSDRDIVAAGAGRRRQGTHRAAAADHLLRRSNPALREVDSRQPQARWRRRPTASSATSTSAAWSMPSFNKFEEELVSVGAGKDGLIIDVRENGGGSTADHLLTVLTQPRARHHRAARRRHRLSRRTARSTPPGTSRSSCCATRTASATPRSSATRSRRLKRGQLVGVPTAGGVISTGAAAIMDVGTLRLPFRGWFDPVTAKTWNCTAPSPTSRSGPIPPTRSPAMTSSCRRAWSCSSPTCAPPPPNPSRNPSFATERPVK